MVIAKLPFRSFLYRTTKLKAIKINLHTTKPKRISNCCIFGQHLNAPRSSRNKVSIIGIGNVGQALTAILLLQKITSNIALVGRDVQKLNRILLDVQQTQCVDAIGIQGSDDYSVTCNSHICVITIGVMRKKGESRIECLTENKKVFFEHVPKIAKYAPDSILIIVTNPVDVLTYLTAKLSNFPKNKVFGSGTNLDTARLRYFMMQKYGVGTDSCEGWVIGEHGATAVTAYSTCKVGGVFVSDVNEKMGQSGDGDDWKSVHDNVLKSGLFVADVKGYTNWAVALSIGGIIKAILNNSRAVCAVSVSAQGIHGIKEDVYLSLPVVLGEDGIVETVRLQLTEDECTKLRKSANFLYGLQREIKLS